MVRTKSEITISNASNQPRVAVAGHICLDIIPSLDASGTRIEPGRLIGVGPAEISTGGAVANTGLALHRLGVPVRLVGKVGDDGFGRILRDRLKSHGEALADGMIVAAGQATSYSIVISPPGVDRSFLHCPGVNDTFDPAADVGAALYEGLSLFHFGYPPLMRRIYADGGRSLRTLFDRIRAGGMTAVSLDMARPDPTTDAGRLDWRAWLAAVLPAVDVFCPSIDELLFMLDRPASDRLMAGEPFGDVVAPERLRHITGELFKLGATICIVKLGEQGLYLRTSDDVARIADTAKRLGLDANAWRAAELHQPCFVARTVAGTTGAGDCTIAGFLSGLLRRENPAIAARAACAVGAASVESPDATGGVPHWTEIERRLRDGWAQHPAGGVYTAIRSKQ